MAVEVHVRDIAHGRPAAGLVMGLEEHAADGWRSAGTVTTDDAGVVPAPQWPARDGATVRIRVDVRRWFAVLGLTSSPSEITAVVPPVGPDADCTVHVLLAPAACTIHAEGSRR